MQGLDLPLGACVAARAEPWHTAPGSCCRQHSPCSSVPATLGCRNTPIPLLNPSNHGHRPKDGDFHLTSCTCSLICLKIAAPVRNPSASPPSPCLAFVT